MRATTFSQWIEKQKNSNDYLGVLGRAASSDVQWRRVFDSYHAFQRELGEMDSSNITEGAICGAWEDYERWLLREGRGLR